MHDVVNALIIIPVIPLFPIAATWWLPWERWIPWGKFPKMLLGPYLIYCSFAAWHFRLGLFVRLVPLLVGLAISFFAILEKRSRPAEE